MSAVNNNNNSYYHQNLPTYDNNKILSTYACNKFARSKNNNSRPRAYNAHSAAPSNIKNIANQAINSS